jgi:hypothetical protein
MEVDLFKHCDEKSSALRMFAHLQKYASHPAAKEWAGQLEELLTPKAPEPPADPKEASP